MRRVLVDTSALFALLVPSDEAHDRARRAFEGLRAGRAVLVTTSYVLLECYALLGRRFGIEQVSTFRRGFVPLLETVWVDQELHERGLDDLEQRDRSSLSLVDVVSFHVFRREQLDEVFAFDRHFEQEGLPLVTP